MELTDDYAPVESHPWPPYIPPHTKVFILGTFPPQTKRWSMDFYYPNRTNDFWYAMGLIFFRDKYALYDRQAGRFDLEAIKTLLQTKGIALHDTARKVRRLKGNASDKYLEILEPAPLTQLLSLMPECHNLATTGEKAASVIAALTDTNIPKMGTYTTNAAGLNIWRMPSTSRAYPLALEKKAAYYEMLFKHANIEL